MTAVKSPSAPLSISRFPQAPIMARKARGRVRILKAAAKTVRGNDPAAADDALDSARKIESELRRKGWAL